MLKLVQPLFHNKVEFHVILNLACHQEESFGSDCFSWGRSSSHAGRWQATYHQKILSPRHIAYLSSCTIISTKAKKKAQTQAGKTVGHKTLPVVAHSRTKRWHKTTSSGVFALMSWLFKLKWYKGKNTNVHGKSWPAFTSPTLH